jgi:alpha-L-rhamnosidase
MAPDRGDVDSDELDIPVDQFASLDDLATAIIAKVILRDDTEFATAHFHNSARLLARIARVLGRTADAAKYDQLADDVRAAWRTEFLRPDGTLTIDDQPTYTRALAFGLVPESLREQTARHLVELIRAAGNHPTTGCPTTPILLPTLAENGYADVAYDLLLEPTAPSWWTVVERGGTTFWEHWESIAADGSTLRSLNLATRANLVEFLHRFAAGIQLLDDAPGYRRFRVAPRPGGGLTWVEAELDSPYGRIASSWRIEDQTFTLTVTVPSGTRAEAILPDGTNWTVDPGTTTLTCGVPVTNGRLTRSG